MGRLTDWLRPGRLRQENDGLRAEVRRLQEERSESEQKTADAVGGAARAVALAADPVELAVLRAEQHRTAGAYAATMRELHRERAHSRALDERLRGLQAANESLTASGAGAGPVLGVAR